MDLSLTGLTFREVYLMAQGRFTNEWHFWASLEALLANINRDPKKGRPFSPNDFHPYLCRSRNERGLSVGDVTAAAKEMDRKRRLKLV